MTKLSNIEIEMLRHAITAEFGGKLVDLDQDKTRFTFSFEDQDKMLDVVASVVTDLLTFSSYKAQEIQPLVLYVCDKAIPTIHVNYKEYGIQDKSDLQIIDIQIFNLTNSAFHKAVGG